MAIGLQRAARPDFFERHVRRLAWYTLFASIALLAPIARASLPTDLGLAGALAALVIAIAVFRLVTDVSRYVRQEQARRFEAAAASRHAGACLAAAAIHDRVANLLSVTVGYVEIVAEEEKLSEAGRQQTEQAVAAAIAATRAVSAYKQSLGCERELLTLADLPPVAESLGQTVAWQPVEGWSYNPRTRTVHAPDGMLVATVAPGIDGSSASTLGRMMTAAPAMWDVLGDAQHVGVSMLLHARQSRDVERDLRDVLDRINTLSDRIQP
jgi:hypothetical protein